MTEIIYWSIKILAWLGIIFSLYSVARPNLMLRFFIKTFQWKMKWFGLKGTIEPTGNAEKLTRVWSVVMALIFFGINYVFGNIITIGYVLEK